MSFVGIDCCVVFYSCTYAKIYFLFICTQVQRYIGSCRDISEYLVGVIEQLQHKYYLKCNKYYTAKEKEELLLMDQNVPNLYTAKNNVCNNVGCKKPYCCCVKRTFTRVGFTKDEKNLGRSNGCILSGVVPVRGSSNVVSITIKYKPGPKHNMSDLSNCIYEIRELQSSQFKSNQQMMRQVWNLPGYKYLRSNSTHAEDITLTRLYKQIHFVICCDSNASNKPSTKDLRDTDGFGWQDYAKILGDKHAKLRKRKKDMNATQMEKGNNLLGKRSRLSQQEQMKQRGYNVGGVVFANLWNNKSWYKGTIVNINYQTKNARVEWDDSCCSRKVITQHKVELLLLELPVGEVVREVKYDLFKVNLVAVNNVTHLRHDGASSSSSGGSSSGGGGLGDMFIRHNPDYVAICSPGCNTSSTSSRGTSTTTKKKKKKKKKKRKKVANNGMSKYFPLKQ